jgi:DNA-directed RNA polymerase specialized sigma24 family protein
VGAVWPPYKQQRSQARGRADPAEEVALVALARRDLLLRAHRFRLRREDLEDCFSQTTMELIARTRAGGTFKSRHHLANVIEQRFLSRIHDRRRALSGRSPMQSALETAVPLDGAHEHAAEIADRRAEVEHLAMLRDELAQISRVAGGLTYDQRLLLASQVGLQMECAEFCHRHGWSTEKYRKVGQRARARLRELIAAENERVPLIEARSEQGIGTNL